MDHVERAKLVKENSYLAENFFFESEDIIQSYKSGPKVRIGYRDIPIGLLKNIITDDDYYQFVYNRFQNERNITIASLTERDIANTLTLRRGEITASIDFLLSNNIIHLSQNCQERFDSLREKEVSVESLKEQYKGTYSISIDGINYSIPYDYLFSVMMFPNDEFNNICVNDSIKSLFGYPKEHFMYATRRFLQLLIDDNDLLMPPIVTLHYNNLFSNQLIDLAAINTHVDDGDEVLGKIEVDDELREAVLSGMKEDMPLPEKAMYVYIKLCKLLTYDDEKYVFDKGEVDYKHKDIKAVKMITPKNNRALCYEFVIIYAKLLHELGIHFSNDYQDSIQMDFGVRHTKLEFRADKFLIKADAVLSALSGDMEKAKFNEQLEGFQCVNKSDKTRKEFKERFDKVYKMIQEEEKEKNTSPQTLDELLKEYRESTENLKESAINERMSILIDTLNSTKLTGLDSLYRLLNIEKALFKPEQISNNVSVVIIQNLNTESEDKLGMASSVIAYNNSGFENDPSKTVYFLFTPGKPLVTISFEEIKRNYDQGTFKYLRKEPLIPGIEYPASEKVNEVKK